MQHLQNPANYLTNLSNQENSTSLTLTAIIRQGFHTYVPATHQRVCAHLGYSPRHPPVIPTGQDRKRCFFFLLVLFFSGSHLHINTPWTIDMEPKY